MELVASGLESKEVAHRLGIKPSTVESHIKSARAKMGGLRRRAVARQLRPPQSLGSQSLGVHPKTTSPAEEASTEPPVTGDRLAEAFTPFRHDQLLDDGVSKSEEPEDDLKRTPIQAIGAALKIALLLMVVLLAASAMMREANERGRPLLPYLVST